MAIRSELLQPRAILSFNPLPTSTMSRLIRRHDKLLRQLLMATRERVAAEHNGASRAQIERLAVRERSLRSSVKRIRLGLGLPETFDSHVEQARLNVEQTKPSPLSRSRRRRRAASEPLWPERARVKPVPASSRRPDDGDGATSTDASIELILHAARFCARRAADELLDHRQSPARGHLGGTIAAWPSKPLAHSTKGDLFAGSAGSLMGDLVARGFDSGEAAMYARAAVRGYVDEFITYVLAALRRERAAVEHLGNPIAEPSSAELVKLERDLAWASCARIATEVRASRRARMLTAEEVAAIGELELDRRPRYWPGTSDR